MALVIPQSAQCHVIFQTEEKEIFCQFFFEPFAVNHMLPMMGLFFSILLFYTSFTAYS